MNLLGQASTTASATTTPKSLMPKGIQPASRMLHFVRSFARSRCDDKDRHYVVVFSFGTVVAGL